MPDQTPPPAASAAELARLNAELAHLSIQQQIADERAKIAEAGKRAQDALLANSGYKGPTITAPNGSITTSDTPYIEIQVLASKTLRTALEKLLQKLQNAIKAKQGADSIRLVILDTTDIAGLELYASVNTQLALLDSGYAQLTTEAKQLLNPTAQPQPKALAAPQQMAMPPVALGAAAAGLVRTAADLTSLFMSTTTYKNTVLADDRPLLLATFAELVRTKASDWSLSIPSIFPCGVLKPTTDSAFYQSLTRLVDTDKEAQKYIPQLQAALASLPLSASQDGSAQLTAALTQLTTLHDAYTQLRLLLVVPGPQTQSILQAERLATSYIGTSTYIVQLRATSTGSTRQRHSLWHNDHRTFSAGTELSYLIFDQTSEVFLAGTEVHYTPYTKAEDILN